MITRILLNVSLLGAEWVLYFLVLLSVLSVALIIERWRFYQLATSGLNEFRSVIRSAAQAGKWDAAIQAAQKRIATSSNDLETEMTHSLVSFASSKPNNNKSSARALEDLAQDAVLRARLGWERNLAILATIGSNSPFIGLFGTVLGIIKAFHDLSQQTGTGAQGVTAGISEALVATAVGILVAIPAVVAFNFFQRRVRSELTRAEALKSFLIGKLSE